MPRSYSISFKIKVVEEYKTCLNNNLVAKRYDIAPKRLREWRAQYEKLKEASASVSTSNKAKPVVTETEPPASATTSSCVAIVSIIYQLPVAKMLVMKLSVLILVFTLLLQQFLIDC